MKRISHFAAAVAAGLCLSNIVEAATVTIETPALDKWHYSNATGDSGASHTNALIFSNSGERLGEALLGFQTSSSIQAGLGAGNYAVTSVKVHLRISTNNSFRYDPTYDGYATYLVGGPADSDVGRPVELLGLGLRNGYTTLSASAGGSLPPLYHERSPWGTEGVANAYGFGIDGNGQRRDVIQNVLDGFDYTPFAIGKTTDASVGGLVPQGAAFEFALDLSNSEILAYVQEGLNSGMLGFMASSLHGSSGQGGEIAFPGFYLKGTGFDEPGDRFTPWMEIEYSVIPEPAPSLLVLMGVALFATGRAWRHRALLS